MLLPNDPTEDQQQIARLGQIEQVQVRKWPRNEMERCVGAHVQKRERATESKNHIHFKGEVTKQDIKCTSELSFLKMSQQWSQVFFPQGNAFSAVS